jgi:hypothetical protein
MTKETRKRKREPTEKITRFKEEVGGKGEEHVSGTVLQAKLDIPSNSVILYIWLSANNPTTQLT